MLLMSMLSCTSSTPASTTAKPAGTTGATTAKEIPNFNATGTKIVNTPVTLEVLTQFDAANYGTKNYNDLKLVQQWAADTNVKVNWTTYPAADWATKKNLLLAGGGKLPDVIAYRITDYDTLTYSAQKYWVPLNDLIDKYTVNLKKAFADYPDVYKSLITPDGNIYTLPRFKGQEDMKYPNRMYINQDWLTKLNLKMPTTIDEFTAVLKAFKTMDPNGNGKADEIPYAFLYRAAAYNWLGSFDRYAPYGFFGTFGTFDTPNHMVLQDGKPAFTANTASYKNAVSWMSQAYTAGYIDPEAFTEDQNAFKAKNTTGDTVYGVWTGWTMEEATKNTPDVIKTYVTMPPLKNSDGKQIWPMFGYNQYSRGYFQITKDCKTPEVAIRWIDYFCEPYFSIQNDWGIKDLGTKINSDGTWSIIGSGQATVRAAEGLPWVLPTFVPPSIYAKGTYGDPVKAYENAGCKVYAPFAVDLLPNVYFPLETTTKMGTLGKSVNDYVTQQTAQWITKGGVDKDWATYTKTLDTMGLGDYVKAYTDAYATFKK